jgi:anti-sigma B factor antagonist
MNVTTDRVNEVVVIRVPGPRMMYPSLAEFSGAVSGQIAKGERRIVIDLSAVSYVDSATIGCLMDLYRQALGAGAVLKLSGVQRRVQTMLTLTGAHNFLEIHADEPSAIKSF